MLYECKLQEFASNLSASILCTLFIMCMHMSVLLDTLSLHASLQSNWSDLDSCSASTSVQHGVSDSTMSNW